MRQTRGKFECEMCGQKRCTSSDDTICYICDREMIKAERALPVISNGRRCKSCGGPCGQSRYFQCETCAPNLETEDPYLEQMDNFEDLEIAALVTHVRAIDIDEMRALEPAEMPQITLPKEEMANDL